MNAEYDFKEYSGSVVIDLVWEAIQEDAITYRRWSVRNRLNQLGLRRARVARLIPKCVPNRFMSIGLRRRLQRDRERMLNILNQKFFS
jgi:hypothetical protein